MCSWTVWCVVVWHRGRTLCVLYVWSRWCLWIWKSCWSTSIQLNDISRKPCHLPIRKRLWFMLSGLTIEKFFLKKNYEKLFYILINNSYIVFFLFNFRWSAQKILLAQATLLEYLSLMSVLVVNIILTWVAKLSVPWQFQVKLTTYAMLEKCPFNMKGVKTYRAAESLYMFLFELLVIVLCIHLNQAPLSGF